MQKSVWTDTVTLPKFESLNGEKKTDVLIIGGGLCGLLCAYTLKQAGVDYILVEGSRIASGITKNTTAKVTSQHGLIYAKLLSSLGKEKAQMYLTANQNALAEYERLCKNIDCDFKRKHAYTYSLTDRTSIEEEIQAMDKLGFYAAYSKTPELPFKTQGAICFPNQAQLHPLKFIAAIVNGLNIYENTFVREITPNCVMTENGKITANKIIVATHFPFINKHGGYFLKLYQHRSYVSAFENVPKLTGMYVDADKKGMSFRSHQNLLLVGGSGHRTGKQTRAWQPLHSLAEKHYPYANLRYDWATQDCMTLDGIPYIGQYSPKTPNLYVATGFNKWGMTSSMVSAMLLCNMVQGKNASCSEVFSPQRTMFKPQLFLNSLEATINLLPPTTRRCPHLGCALKWNCAEHTWDCPCHGSRFEQNGSLLDNPATGNASIE